MLDGLNVHHCVFGFLESEPYKYLEDVWVDDNSDHQNQLLALNNSRYVMRRDSQEQFTKKAGGRAPVKKCQIGCLISMMERMSR